MKPAILAGLLCVPLLAAGGYLGLADRERPVATGSTGSIVPSPGVQPPGIDPRPGLTVMNISWRREGFGLTAAADVSVRNSNSYAVQIDRVSCRFRTKSGAMEDHAQGVFAIIQPRSERVIRDVSLGFVNAQDKGVDCSVAAARKGS